jgi:hypothetical protein
MAIQDIRNLDVGRAGLRVARLKENDAGVLVSNTERTTKSIVGALAVLIGAWEGLVPFIGHAIRFSADGSATWTWNLQHALLYLTPAIAAVVGGSLLLLSVWIDRVHGFALATVTLPIATLLLGLSGIWFIVGSSVWPIFYSGHVFAAASPLRTFVEKLAYNFAAGLVLSAIAAVAGMWTIRALRRSSNP